MIEEQQHQHTQGYYKRQLWLASKYFGDSGPIIYPASRLPGSLTFPLSVTNRGLSISPIRSNIPRQILLLDNDKKKIWLGKAEQKDLSSLPAVAKPQRWIRRTLEPKEKLW